MTQVNFFFSPDQIILLTTTKRTRRQTEPNIQVSLFFPFKKIHLTVKKTQTKMMDNYKNSSNACSLIPQFIVSVITFIDSF